MADREQPLAERPLVVAHHRDVEVRIWGLYGNWIIWWPGNVLHRSSWTDEKARALIDWQLDNPNGPNPYPWLKLIPIADRQQPVPAAPVAQETQPTAAVTAPQPILAEVLEQKPAPAVEPKPKKPTRKDADRMSKMTRDDNGRLVF